MDTDIARLPDAGNRCEMRRSASDVHNKGPMMCVVSLESRDISFRMLVNRISEMRAESSDSFKFGTFLASRDMFSPGASASAADAKCRANA